MLHVHNIVTGENTQDLLNVHNMGGNMLHVHNIVTGENTQNLLNVHNMGAPA